MRKVKFLFTDLFYLNHNYGAQGITIPLIKRLGNYFNGEYTFIFPKEHCADQFARNKGFNMIEPPNSIIALSDCHKSILIVYLFINLIKRKGNQKRREKQKYLKFLEIFKEQDVIVDLSGIEFIGNQPLKRKVLYYIKTFCLQCLAKKYKKIYLKYTKSYGPFPGKIYRYFVKKSLNHLPFVFVRGETNLEQIKKLKLKVPTYSFPDISIALEPERKEWANEFLKKFNIDLSQPIIGLSPSSVIANLSTKDDNSSCGDGHIILCKKIIEFFQEQNKQVLLIPHSVLDGKNLLECDLALSKKIYSELKNKNNVFLISELDLSYQQVRSIIRLLDFYITGRYHSVASALSVATPVVSFAWHVKYNDIMSLFLDDFLTLDYRKNRQEVFSLIKRYYENRDWFDKEKITEKRKDIIDKIYQSISIMVNEINAIKK
jgi:polysaccharide pyruvyl transferase WcaK-like protein